MVRKTLAKERRMQYGEFYFTLFRKARIFIVDKLNEVSGEDENGANKQQTRKSNLSNMYIFLQVTQKQNCNNRGEINLK